MKPDTRNALKAFLVELVVYAAFVVGYVFLVLHFLSGLLLHLFQDDRQVYAYTALVLIAAQGFVLEILTRTLLGLVRRKGEKK
jgi:hypothetical protein